MTYFAGFDTTDFWDDSPYALRDYVEDPPTPQLIADLERELGGYRLPGSYVALMRTHNGGVPQRPYFPLPAQPVPGAHSASATSSAPGSRQPESRPGLRDPVPGARPPIALNGIFGIGRNRPNSLGGEFGSRFWIEDWEYPALGVYFADTPSAGHDMLAFDYRGCGGTGEPAVVHVDQEDDFRVTWVAENFEAFVRGLVADAD